MKRLAPAVLLLLTASLTACGATNSLPSQGSSKSTQEKEMFAPEAKAVYSNAPLLETLGNEEGGTGTKVIYKHVFSNGEEYEYTLSDDMVVSGDIVLGTYEELKDAIAEYEAHLASGEGLSSQGAIHEGVPIDPGSFFDFGYRNDEWPYGIVFYKPPSTSLFTLAQRTQISKAMAYIESATGGKVDFRLADSGTGSYLVFSAHAAASGQSGCWSYLGRKGGAQELNLTPSSYTCFGQVNSRGFDGSIVHEFGHALGMIHEQERHDRNEYMNLPSSTPIFPRDVLEHVTTYDYGSIMHYPYTSSQLKKPYSGTVGQRYGFSSRDLQSLDGRY